jgi:Winged helix DNA-binding domain
VRLPVSPEQAVAARLAAHHLSERLPAGSHVEAARFGLQDTAPRDALLGLHARMRACEPDAWQDPRLIQTYSPRAAVYLLPRQDFGIFTIGRLPLDPAARQQLESLAADLCRELNGQEVRGSPGRRRAACATGRIAVRWTTSALWVREVPRPEIDFDEAHAELCRRHVHAFGPTTPGVFAWWAGLAPQDARQVWARLAGELLPVDLGGHEAWILAADEPAVRSPPPLPDVRLLVAPDLRLLGQDRAGRFVGPGLRKHTPAQDWFHPNGVLAGGRIVGAWGRRGGRVSIKVEPSLPARARQAIEAEALSFPFAATSADITDFAGAG